MKRIIVTGGDGRFATELKKIKTNHKVFFLNKKQLNILESKSILKAIKKFKPDYMLHLAGLSRPLINHEKKITESIKLNIIGTANLLICCVKFNIKFIYFSTNYVYPGRTGDYKETDPLLPWSNYGWSKLGGEAAVQMYKNSLILRVCMTQEPFIHKKAYSNVKSNFIFHRELAKNIFKIIHKKGIFNIGGKTQTIFNFAKIYNKNVKRKISNGSFPLKQDMNLEKIKKII